MAGGERDEMGEALQGDHLTVAHVTGHRLPE